MDRGGGVSEPLHTSSARLALWPPSERRLHKLKALRQFREDLKEARAAFEQDQEFGIIAALFAAYYLLVALDPYDHDGLHQLFRAPANQHANDRKGLPIYDVALMAHVAAAIKALTEIDVGPDAKNAKAERAARELVRIYDRCGAPYVGRARRGTPRWKVLFGWWDHMEKGHYGEDGAAFYDENCRHLAANEPALTRQEVFRALEGYLNKMGWVRRKRQNDL